MVAVASATKDPVSTLPFGAINALLVEVGSSSSASSGGCRAYPRRLRAWAPRARTVRAWRAPVGEGRGSPLPEGPHASLPSPVSLMNGPRR